MTKHLLLTKLRSFNIFYIEGSGGPLQIRNPSFIFYGCGYGCGNTNGTGVGYGYFQGGGVTDDFGSGMGGGHFYSYRKDMLLTDYDD
jgi:hypothetical protein